MIWYTKNKEILENKNILCKQKKRKNLENSENYLPYFTNFQRIFREFSSTLIYFLTIIHIFIFLKKCNKREFADVEGPRLPQ